MANERPTLDLTKKASSPEEQKRKEFRARAAKVVTRAYIVDRLNVDLPTDVHGEWIRDDPVAIAEARALGFEIDKEYATKHAIHTNASGEAKVGDAVFMTMPKWQKEEIDKLKKEQYERHHGVRRGTKPVEETQFESSLSKSLPVINESKTENKSMTTISE